MLPSQIENDVFNKLKSEIDNIEPLKFNYKSTVVQLDIENLIDYCYREDENVTPSLYRLLDINQIIPGFEFEVKKKIIIII
jgi:hypothetical protein